MTSLEHLTALVFDPVTWVQPWSYEKERSLLAERGVALLVPDTTSQRDILTRHADVVIASSIEPITAAVIASLEHCVGILCYSAGMDAVDIAAAERAGIRVTNVNAGTAEVADHAMALLLAAARMIVPMTAATAQGDWDLRNHPEIWDIRRLTGQTLGIVGAGRVGRAVAHRARAFGFETIATHHHPPTTPDPELAHVELQELFALSDAIVICASLGEDSRGMVGAEVLAATKPGAILVNVSRGAIVDEAALAEALGRGLVRVAALDVRNPEPPGTEDAWRHRPDVIQTPHMAGASFDAREDLHQLAAAGVLQLLTEAGRLQ
jgi:D-3-phosphoglycerate dehydrogenase / 2-oxoglutarate reductase